ncbi:MAG: hypothetical protein AAFO98_01830 [Pseudomonadota bacterium]
MGDDKWDGGDHTKDFNEAAPPQTLRQKADEIKEALPEAEKLENSGITTDAVLDRRANQGPELKHTLEMDGGDGSRRKAREAHQTLIAELREKFHDTSREAREQFNDKSRDREID